MSEKETILMLSSNKSSMVFDITTPFINVNSIEVLKTRITQSENTFEIERRVPFILLSTWIPYHVAINPDNILNIISSVSYTVNSSTTDKISYMPLKESYSLTLYNIEHNTNTGLYLPYFNDDYYSGQSLADMTNTWLQNIYNNETFYFLYSYLFMVGTLDNTNNDTYGFGINFDFMFFNAMYDYYYTGSAYNIPPDTTVSKQFFVNFFNDASVNSHFSSYLLSTYNVSLSMYIENDKLNIRAVAKDNSFVNNGNVFPTMFFGWYATFKFLGFIQELPIPGTIPSYYPVAQTVNVYNLNSNYVNQGTHGYNLTGATFIGGIGWPGHVRYPPNPFTTSFGLKFSDYQISPSTTIKITSDNCHFYCFIYSYSLNKIIKIFEYDFIIGTFSITDFLQQKWNGNFLCMYYIPEIQSFVFTVYKGWIAYIFNTPPYPVPYTYKIHFLANSNILSQLGFYVQPYGINSEPLFYTLPVVSTPTTMSITAKYPFSHVPNVSCVYVSNTNTISFNASYSFQIYPLNGYEVYGFQENYVHIAQPVYNSLKTYSIQLYNKICLKGSNVVYIQCNEWYMNNIIRDYGNLFAEVYFCNPKNYIYQGNTTTYKRKLNNISKLSKLSLTLYSDSKLTIPYHCNGKNWYIELLITHN